MRRQWCGLPCPWHAINLAAVVGNLLVGGGRRERLAIPVCIASWPVEREETPNRSSPTFYPHGRQSQAEWFTPCARQVAGLPAGRAALFSLSRRSPIAQACRYRRSLR